MTLSIWLHGWSDHRREQKETQEFLRGLKDVNVFETNMLNLEMNKDDKMTFRDLAKSFKLRALMQITASNLEGCIESCHAAQQQARKIIAVIPL